MSHLGLSAHRLRFAHPGGREVLRGADLVTRPGRRTALLGGNGSGKTTLLRCLSGALRPAAGHVALDDTPIEYSRKGLRSHRQQVQLVLQDPDDQLFSASVRQDVSYGPVNLGLPDADVRARVDEALDRLSIGPLADRPVHRLSYGERKRVAVAGALAMRPCVLLLDEPTAGLDPAGVEELLAALHRLERTGTSVVLSTHDVDLALRWADDVGVVGDGVVAQGPATKLLADADLLLRCRLRPPGLLRVASALAERGHLDRAADVRDVDGLITAMTPGADCGDVLQRVAGVSPAERRSNREEAP